MDEQENKRPVPDADRQKPAPREALSMDSIEAPVNVLHGKIAQGSDLPFAARSTGKYREGRGFSYYREGFDAYCFFVTVSGAGEITYRGETKRVERGDMVFVSSVLPALTRSLNDDWRFCFVNIAGEYCGYFESLWNRGGFTVIRPRDAGYYTEILDRITKELGDPSPMGELTVNLLITRLLTEALEEHYGGEPSPKPATPTATARRSSAVRATPSFWRRSLPPPCWMLSKTATSTAPTVLRSASISTARAWRCPPPPRERQGHPYPPRSRSGRTSDQDPPLHLHHDGERGGGLPSPQGGDPL